MRARFAHDLTMFLTALTMFAGLAGGNFSSRDRLPRGSFQ